MAHKDMIEAEGEVTGIHRGGMMTVQLDNGHEVIAKLSGKMSMHHIRCLVTDRVQVELSPYDMTKARILYRYK